MLKNGKQKVNVIIFYWYHCAITLLVYVTFHLPGWIEQSSSPSLRQNSREPKTPLSWVTSGHSPSNLSFQDQFSDSYLMRSFLYTFCSLGYFCPNTLLAPTHWEEKQLYDKTALLKALEAPFHSKAILPFLQEHTCTSQVACISNKYWRLVSHLEALLNLENGNLKGHH